MKDKLIENKHYIYPKLSDIIGEFNMWDSSVDRAVRGRSAFSVLLDEYALFKRLQNEKEYALYRGTRE